MFSKINTKIKKMFKDLFRSSSGMTMIEILMAMAIILLLMGVTMISLPRYRDSQTLEQVSKDVNDTLRQAQTWALSPNMPKAEYYVWDIKTGAADDEQCPNRQYIGVMADVEDAYEKKTCLDDKVNLQAENIGPLYFEVKTGKIFNDEALTIPANGKLTIEHDNHPGDSGLYYEINIVADTFSLGKEVVSGDQGGLTLACGNGECEAEKGEKCGTCGDCECLCPNDGLQYCSQQSCPSANWYDGSCHELPKPSATCGDGDRQPGEVCDDGNVSGGDYCSADCQEVTGVCGDGQKQGSERCDDGANNGKYGYCNANCSTQIKCGDGTVQTSNETCDDGSANGTYGKCNTSCSAILRCGDQIITSPEVCDDGDLNGTNGKCNRECSGILRCGDGVVTSPEVCDDGQANGQYNKCNTQCTAVLRCGDGTTQTQYGEICDSGTANGTAIGKCNTQCTGLLRCGDSIVTAPEVCDEGSLNGTSGHCNTSCSAIITLRDGSQCSASNQCQSGLCAAWYGSSNFTCKNSYYRRNCGSWLLTCK